jgi:hypothetical protein
MKPNLNRIIEDNLDKAKFQSKLQPSLPKNTGWLDGYADGGGTYISGKALATQFGQYPVGGQAGPRQPIITNNFNDPRLKAYNDSLNLYNKFKNPVHPEPFFQKLSDEDVKMFVNAYNPSNGTMYHPTGGVKISNRKEAQDFIDSFYKKERNEFIKEYGMAPLGTDAAKQDPKRMSHRPYFKQPVQPVVYQKEHPIKKVDGKLAIPEREQLDTFADVNMDRQISPFVFEQNQTIPLDKGAYEISYPIYDGKPNSKNTIYFNSQRDWQNALDKNFILNYQEERNKSGTASGYLKQKKNGGWLDEYPEGGEPIRVTGRDPFSYPSRNASESTSIPKSLMKNAQTSEEAAYQQYLQSPLSDKKSFKEWKSFKESLPKPSTHYVKPTKEKLKYEQDKINQLKQNLIAQDQNYSIDETGAIKYETPFYENKTFNKFADNIVLPAAEAATYLTGAGETYQGLKTLANLSRLGVIKGLEKDALVNLFENKLTKSSLAKGLDNNLNQLGDLADYVNLDPIGIISQVGLPKLPSSAIKVGWKWDVNTSKYIPDISYDKLGVGANLADKTYNILPNSAQLSGISSFKKLYDYENVPNSLSKKSIINIDALKRMGKQLTDPFNPNNLKAKNAQEWMKEWYSHPEILARMENYKTKPSGNFLKSDIINNIDINRLHYFNDPVINPIQDKNYIDLFKEKGLNEYLKQGSNHGVSYYNSGSVNPSSVYVNRTPFFPFNKKGLESTKIHEATHAMESNGLMFNAKEKADLLEPFGYTEETYNQLKPSTSFSLNRPDYYVDPTEIHARINEARYDAGLKPGEEFTKKMYNAAYKKDKFNGMGRYVKDHQKMRDLINKFYVTVPAIGVGTAAALNEEKYGGDISIPSLNNKWLNKYENGSIVDYLADRNQDFSYSHRTELAKELGIENYRGSAEQNLRMLSMLKQASQPKKEIDREEINKEEINYNLPEQSIFQTPTRPINSEKNLDNFVKSTFKKQEGKPKEKVNKGLDKVTQEAGWSFKNKQLPQYVPVDFNKISEQYKLTHPNEKYVPEVKEKHWYDRLGEITDEMKNNANNMKGINLGGSGFNPEAAASMGKDIYNLTQQGINYAKRTFGKHNEQVSELVIPSKPVVSKNSKVPPVDTPAVIRGKTIHLINDLEYAPEIVDLNKINVGVRNRGDINPINTKGIIFSPVGVNNSSKDFKPSDTIKLKSSQGYVGVDKSGKIKIGFGDDFKNDIYQISPFKIIKDVTGFSKQKDDYELADASQAKKGYFSPVLKTLKGDKEATGTLVESNKYKNTYGDITGGHVIFTSPDFSKKIVVSGSVVDIENALENFKKENDLKTVNFVQVDNGTYNKNVIPKKGVLTAKDLNILDNFNEYGNNFIYMKKQGGQISWLDKYK